MTNPRPLAPVLTLALLSGSSAFAHQQAGLLSGTARDAALRPLSGMTIKLANREHPAEIHSTVSDASGRFHFAGLQFGTYSLTAVSGGHAIVNPTLIRIDATSSSVVADVMVNLSGSTEVSAQVTASQAAVQEPPSFQASGIRGLIDPGGYSASTDGLAANLVRDMATVQHPDQKPSAELTGQPCELEPQLLRAVSERPGDAEAFRRLGQFYRAHGDNGQAIPLLRQALKLRPSDRNTVHELALALVDTGQLAEARSLLADLVQKHGDAADVQLLARAEQDSGMFTEAAQEYGEAQKLDPGEENAFGLADNLLLAGSARDSAEEFRLAAGQYPRSIALQIGLGVAESMLGQYSEALRHFLLATDIDPTDPRPYPFIAEESGKAGDQQARLKEVVSRYLQHDPASAEATYLYALLLSGTAESDTPQTEALLRRAIQLDATRPEFHLLLADTLVRRGSYSLAIPQYELAIHCQPDLPKPHYRLSLAYRHTGESRLASREMQAYLTLKQQSSTEDTAMKLARFSSSMVWQKSKLSDAPCMARRQ